MKALPTNTRPRRVVLAGRAQDLLATAHAALLLQGKAIQGEPVKVKRPINWERLMKATRPVAFSTHYKTVHIGDDHSNGIERLYDFVRWLWLALRKGGAR